MSVVKIEYGLRAFRRRCGRRLGGVGIAQFSAVSFLGAAVDRYGGPVVLAAIEQVVRSSRRNMLPALLRLPQARPRLHDGAAVWDIWRSALSPIIRLRSRRIAARCFIRILKVFAACGVASPRRSLRRYHVPLSPLSRPLRPRRSPRKCMAACRQTLRSPSSRGLRPLRRPARRRGETGSNGTAAASFKRTTADPRPARQGEERPEDA